MSDRGDDAITTIPLRKATRDRLRALGAKGETYDAILHRLIDAFQTARTTPSAAATYVEFERVEHEPPPPPREPASKESDET